MVSSCKDTDIENATKLLCRERKERLKCDCKGCADLEGNIQDRSGSVHICLRYLPRFCVCKILVTKAGYVHCLLESLTELVTLKVSLHLLLERLDLCKCLCIDSLRLEVSRNLSFKIFMSQNDCTVHEVTEDGNKFAIVT